jgi:hypothetical protein
VISDKAPGRHLLGEGPYCRSSISGCRGPQSTGTGSILHRGPSDGPHMGDTVVFGSPVLSATAGIFGGPAADSVTGIGMGGKRSMPQPHPYGHRIFSSVSCFQPLLGLVAFFILWCVHLVVAVVRQAVYGPPAGGPWWQWSLNREVYYPSLVVLRVPRSGLQKQLLIAPAGGGPQNPSTEASF